MTELNKWLRFNFVDIKKQLANIFVFNLTNNFLKTSKIVSVCSSSSHIRIMLLQIKYVVT